MTKAQQKWTDKVTGKLKEEIERRWPLSDKDWEALMNAVGAIMKKARGNAEVRAALFEIMEDYEKKEREETRKREELNG